MKVLVIGYGSIGARHARILTELGHQVAVVSGRDIEFPLCHNDLPQALASGHPDCVVVATATGSHHDAVSELARHGFEGTVLVEKPLFHRVMELPPHRFRQGFVAYNLRFHPVIQQLRGLLRHEQILTVQAYVGQYLPLWRPLTDYRNSYSASASLGGGALRDLSHELDYLNWLLGGWQRVTALGGHLSPLEISSDDAFALMLTTAACPVVTLQVNYLDRLTRRFLLINTAQHTIEADLVRGTITIDRDTETFALERDQTYRLMHEELLSGKGETLCTIGEGYESMRLIEAAEYAAKHQEWVRR